MAEKELRRMNRTELIEIIYALQQQELSLRQDNEKLTNKLNDRNIRISQAGSIAEAALSLNQIFEDAQNAAEEYLQSVMDINSQTDEIINAAKEEAETIVASARVEAEEIIEKGKQEVEEQKNQFFKTSTAMLRKYPELGKAMKTKMRGEDDG